jgi:tyrosine-protein phosphatase SIW14
MHISLLFSPDGPKNCSRTLVEKDEPDGYQAFMQAHGIKHIVINMKGTNKSEISPVVMNSIMEVLLERQNYPLLVHCNRGKVRALNEMYS